MRKETLMRKRVVIAGGGLAGLRTASVLIDRGFEVTVLERAPMAGGCTSSWTDHRDPMKRSIRKGQLQMNFPFYENLNFFAWRELNASNRFLPEPSGAGGWWARGNSAYSEPLDGFHFFDHHGRRTSLSGVPKTVVGKAFHALPAPFSALQVLWEFDGLPRLRDKLSAGQFHALALIFGDKSSPPVSDDWNFYGLMKSTGFTHEAVQAYRRITYSITNLADADQVGPKFMRLFYLSYLRDKDALGCRMMNDDCNPALIDRTVESLMNRGVKFRFNSHIRDILVEGDKCVGFLVHDMTDAGSVICPNCGLKFNTSEREAFCSACGIRFRSKGPVDGDGKREVLEADHYVSALQPHQLAALYRGRDDHPLRNFPDFRALGQFKGAILTVSRIFMDSKITEGYNLTGLDRDFFSMNGVMDLSHIMPKYQTSVFDTLSDDGEVLEMYPEETLKAKLRADVGKVFPSMEKARVTGHLMARIGPEVLYHRPSPRLNSRFLPDGPKTSLSNFYLAGDWVDEYELGKEAAVKSGLNAANAVLANEGRSSEAEPVLKPSTGRLVGAFQSNPVSRWIRARYERQYLSELPPKRGR